jgi:TonB family protein
MTTGVGMVLRWFWILVLVAAVSGATTELRGQTNSAGHLASAVPPVYPLAAKAAGIEGKVELRGVIGTDGKMRNIRAIKGPPELRQAAIDAVMRWVYHPYTQEVITTVTVNFTLGSKKEKAVAQEEARAALAKADSENSAKEAVQTPKIKD